MSIHEQGRGGKEGGGRMPADMLAFLVAVLALGAAFGLGVLAGKELQTEHPEDRVWIEQLSGGEAPLQAAAASAPKAEAPPSTGAYVGSRNGTKYHLPDCSGAKRIKPENQVWFATKEQATAAGYTPAANCPGL